MRAPRPTSPLRLVDATETETAPMPEDVIDGLATSLAALLLGEYHKRHPQRNQQPAAATVVSPLGLHRDDRTEGGAQ